MPERLEGLSRADVSEALDLFWRTNTVEGLRAATKMDERLRSPVIHGMLRQEYTSVKARKDLDPELKEGILHKFYLFFEFLHEDAYGKHVNELLGKSLPKEERAAANSKSLDKILSGPQSVAEAALVTVGAFYELGLAAKLFAAADIRPPWYVDRIDPYSVFTQIQNLADHEVAGGWSMIERLVPLNAATLALSSRRSLGCCVVFGCVECRNEFAALHRYFVKDTSGQEGGGLLTQELNRHSCPRCGSERYFPLFTLADEMQDSLDPLLASCCVATPHPEFRIVIPPPMTERNKKFDRILEVRLTQLEDRCKKALGEPDRGDGPVSYRIVYSRPELARSLLEIRNLTERAGLGDKDQVSRAIGESLVHEAIDKVNFGFMPLDMAMEHVRKMARAQPELDIPLPLYSDVSNGDPNVYLTALMVAKAFYEEREGVFALKALLCIFASQAYTRIGDHGQARAEFLRARTFRDQAKDDDFAEEVDRMLLQIEADHALREGSVGKAVQILQDVVRLEEKQIADTQSSSGAKAERVYNGLLAKNALGAALLRSNRFSEALRCFHDIEEAAIQHGGECRRAATNLDSKEAEHLSSLASSCSYLAGGAVANGGAVCCRLAELSKAVFSQLPSPLAGIQLSEFLRAFDQMEPDRFGDFRGVVAACAEALEVSDGIPCTKVTGMLIQKAITCYRLALGMSQEVEGHSFAAIQAAMLADLMMKSGGDAGEVEEYLKTAIKHARTISSQRVLADTLPKLASLRESAGLLDEAADLLDETIQLTLRMRIAAGVDSSKERLSGEIPDLVSRSIRLRHSLGQYSRAIEVIENFKCNLLSLELERSSLRLESLGPEADRIEDLRALVARRERSWMELLDLSPDAGRVFESEAVSQRGEPSVADDLDKVDERIRQLREDLVLRHPRFAEWCRWSNVEQFRIQDLQPVIDSWAKPPSIVGFFVSNDLLWWYNLCGTETRIAPIPLGEGGLEKLRRRLAHMRGEFARSPTGPEQSRDVLQQLAELLAPAFRSLPPNKAGVIICPHDFLFWLPWSLLPFGEELLVERGLLYEIPGLSLLNSLRPRRKLPGDPRVVVVSDPQQATEQALPGAALEARVLRSAFGDRCDILEGSFATVEALARTCPIADVLHFCCHGSFGGFGEDAGRLFLAPSAGDDGETGILSCNKIVERLELRGNTFVNLAACDSGLVRPEKGAEIDGISRAFLCAGANAVLGSLWPLEDQAAAKFSETFYNHLSRTEDPAMALNKTQLACLHGELGEQMTQHCNWASYVFIGAPAIADGLDRSDKT